MIVCLCTGVNSDQFTQALQEHGFDWLKASAETGAGGCCGGCQHFLAQMAEREQEKAQIIPLPVLACEGSERGQD